MLLAGSGLISTQFGNLKKIKKIKKNAACDEGESPGAPFCPALAKGRVKAERERLNRGQRADV